MAFKYRRPWIAGPGFKPETYAGTGSLRTKTARVPKLFTPITQRGVTFKNRIVVSPLCQYSSEDGFFNDWHLCHLGNFARGGAGLVFFEATAVTENGRITPYCTGLWKDDHIAPAKRVVDFIHSQWGLAGIQLAHAGRKASAYPPLLTFHPNRGAVVGAKEGGWPDRVQGPTTIPFDANSAKPHQLSVEEIGGVVAAFVAAAKRAEQAGFDVVEIHGAHGYLISSFLSPLSNKRTDQYGGSFENRIRLLVEVAGAIRAVWSKPLWVRVSCTDWAEGGWDIEQTVKLAKVLKDIGVDTIDCSSGGNWAAAKGGPIGGFPGYQAPFAAEVGRVVSSCAVGAISGGAQAETILNNNPIDFVAIGRAIMSDPFLPLKAAKELGLDVHWTPQYEWAVNPPPAKL